MRYGIPTKMAADVPWLAKPRQAERSFSLYEPARLAIPMWHGIGAACRPVVAAGDQVLKYQPLGECEGGVMVHAGVSGRVAGVKKVPHISGGWQEAVVLDNDAACLEMKTTPPNKKMLHGYGLFLAMRTAGIPDEHGGSHHDPRGRVDICLINGCECEPAIDADEILMRTFPEAIVRGAIAFMRAAGAREAIIGVESNRAAALADLRRASVDRTRKLDVRDVPETYPVGSMQQFVHRLTGREYGPDQRPEDVGVTVIGVAAALAVHQLITTGKPFTHRMVSVIGDVANPQTVFLPIGATVRDVLQFCGGWVGRPARILMGGPLTGRSVRRLDTPIIKTANGIVVVNEEHVDPSREYACIRCNRCSASCPVRLMPQFIDASRRRGDWKECERLQARNCVRCGCCSYVCPSSIPLATSIGNLADALIAADGEEYS